MQGIPKAPEKRQQPDNDNATTPPKGPLFDALRALRDRYAAEHHSSFRALHFTIYAALVALVALVDAWGTGLATTLAADLRGLALRVSRELRPVARHAIDLAALESLTRRIVARYARKHAGLLDRADIEAIVKLRAVELVERFEPIAAGPSFEGYAWRGLCGAVEEAAGLETRERAKARRVAFELAAELHTDGPDDDGRNARSRTHAFLQRVAMAGALALVSEATSAGAVPSDLEGTARSLREALDKLEPRTREVLRLRFFEERTIAEVAKELGVSTATVRREQLEGLAKLARMMGVNRE